jgi:hypothetical protein
MWIFVVPSTVDMNSGRCGYNHPLHNTQYDQTKRKGAEEGVGLADAKGFWFATYYYYRMFRQNYRFLC